MTLELARKDAKRNTEHVAQLGKCTDIESEKEILVALEALKVDALSEGSHFSWICWSAV